MRRTTLDLPDALFEQMDRVRGDIPRNRWITRAIEQALVPRLNPEVAMIAHRGDEVTTTKKLTEDRREGLSSEVAPSTSRGHAFEAQKVAPNRCAVCGVLKGRHA